jgi:hypothetical protein
MEDEMSHPRWVVGVLFLAVAGTAVATNQWPEKPVPAADPGIHLEDEVADLRGIAVLLADGPWAAQNELSQAVRYTLDHCAYQRAAALLPSVLDRVLARHNPGTMTPNAAAAHSALRTALATHQHTLVQMGAGHVEIPEPGSHLALTPGIPNSAQLDAQDRPELAMAMFLDEIGPITSAMDDPTREGLAQAGEVLKSATQGRWPMKRSLLATRDRMHVLAAHLDPGSAAALDVDALIGLLDDFIAQRC